MTVFPFPFQEPPPSVYSSEYLKRNPLRSLRNAQYKNRQLNKSLEKMLIHPKAIYRHTDSRPFTIHNYYNILYLVYTANFTP